MVQRARTSVSDQTRGTRVDPRVQSRPEPAPVRQEPVPVRQEPVPVRKEQPKFQSFQANPQPKPQPQQQTFASFEPTPLPASRPAPAQPQRTSSRNRITIPTLLLDKWTHRSQGLRCSRQHSTEYCMVYNGLLLILLSSYFTASHVGHLGNIGEFEYRQDLKYFMTRVAFFSV